MTGIVDQVERELKLRLTEHEWTLLRQELGTPLCTHQQTNTYFDTSQHDLRHRLAIMVRIRSEDSAYELTVKDRIHGEQSGQLETRERTEPLRSELATAILERSTVLTEADVELAKHLRKQIGAELKPVGQVKNTREAFVLGQGYIAELDRTEFPGGRVDYEVEIELRNDSHTYVGARNALQLHTSIQCSALPPSRSKYARFLSCLTR